MRMPRTVGRPADNAVDPRRGGWGGGVVDRGGRCVGDRMWVRNGHQVTAVRGRVAVAVSK
ncbi:hypothetical protein GCM10023340_22700 [Nocardioides marinquilinus]|uniref:Uncharacterized protein n=1 Tax=Nocardioides marinquilinus TaxID=1210400 RepID=A0ABP9PT60_9ACTN